MSMLDVYGMGRTTLFPGLDSVCDYINDWYVRD